MNRLLWEPLTSPFVHCNEARDSRAKARQQKAAASKGKKAKVAKQEAEELQYSVQRLVATLCSRRLHQLVLEFNAADGAEVL
jgi:hypothetical protein